MKVYFSSLLLLLSSADAFAPSPVFGRTATLLSVTKDTTEAVAAAKEASEKFGATSPEARVAWELVEEIDASNSHEKQMEKAKEQAAEAALMEDIEPCDDPVVRQDNSEAVEMALEASKIYGKTSVEARMAWDLVEELDAANARHRSGDIHVKKEEECSTEEPAPQVGKKQPPTTVEEAIADAKMISQVYGKTSEDAKVAWELVEEMDSASSHTKAAQKAKEEKPKVEKKVVEIKTTFKDSSEAIKAALAASKEHGPTSVEARMAWELVEEIDSANAHHKTVGSG